MEERRRIFPRSAPPEDAATGNTAVDSVAERSGNPISISKPPIILMKPQQRKVVEDDEEWPTINKSVTIIKHQSSQQPQSRPNQSASPTPATSGGQSSTYSNQGPSQTLRRPPVVSGHTVSSSGQHYGYSTKAESTVRPLNCGVKLITESMEWSEIALDHLIDQPDFLVVGVIGPQGVGKSTLMSMIGGNDPFDLYRQYIFRPASKECTETGGHQTQGVQIYVNDNRTILLDSQAILSPSVMSVLMNYDHRHNYDCGTLENYVELESMQLVAFMLQVCHVVVFLFDYFVDFNLLKFLRTCDMLKPSLPLSENPTGVDHLVHVVFVQNRAKKEDFTINSVKKKCTVIEKMLSGSNVLYNDGVSMKRSSYPTYQTLKDCSANFYALPDMKPRGFKAEAHHGYKGVPDFEVMIRELRNQILALPRHPFSPPLNSERAWFLNAARMWDMSRKSLLIAEFGRLLP